MFVFVTAHGYFCPGREESLEETSSFAYDPLIFRSPTGHSADFGKTGAVLPPPAED
jgi:hypothetical protein